MAIRSNSRLTIGHIALIGFSGSGKSTTGPLLARYLRRRCIDLDARIEQQTGSLIPLIFERFGERKFRHIEYQQLKSILAEASSPLVIVLGGGTIVQKRVRRLLQQQDVHTVWLRCAVRTIERRLRNDLSRPLLLDDEGNRLATVQDRITRIRARCHQRIPFYSMADFSISTTNRTPARVASRIAELLHAR